MRSSNLIVRGAVAMMLVMMGLTHQAAAQEGALPSRIEAVQFFADTLIEHGRDTFRDEQTPLFVDRLNMETLEAVPGKDGEGNEVMPSNLARHQNLFRALVGLTNLTGEAKYRQAAEDAIRYHFEHLTPDCGLLQWGGHRWIDLYTGKHTGDKAMAHELKFHLPFYELMWEVDSAATERFIKALWNAHVVNWGTLDMNRHGSYERELGALWDNEFGDP
ncbi:MAG: pectate lyase, partial [Armatimonadota bacterium]